MPRSLRPGFWTQSFAFSCGPSALGSVLESLGWSPGRHRSEEELEIWRESTAIACPGTHPFGLALAATRRGFLAEVRTAGPRPWLWRHIRRQHRSLALRQYQAIETSLVEGCRRAGVRLRQGGRSPGNGHAGLLLTRAPSPALRDVDPHWIGLLPAEGSMIVMDPLRAREYRSDRSVEDWWEDSGFDGTKSWVEIRPAKGATAGGPDERVVSGRSSQSAPAHGHPHHLARRGWSREEGLAWLESPERRSTQDPEVVWNRVGLKPGETVVDIGAGTGYFAVSAARRVGTSGRVYAVDVSRELVELLHERSAEKALPQLIPVRSTPEAIPIDSGLADVLLFANVLHDIPSATISEAVRLLRPSGRAVNVDWKKDDTPGGPPLEIRLAPEEATALLAEHGLELADRWEFGPWHYGLTLHRIETGSLRVPGDRHDRRT
jgi:SAM-dependent methyltransferase